MNEKLLEKKLRDRVKKIGGMAIKFASPYHTGMPDRIVLMPGGLVAFAEIKTTGKKPTSLQTNNLRRLQALGFMADVVDSEKTLDQFIEKIKIL